MTKMKNGKMTCRLQMAKTGPHFRVKAKPESPLRPFHRLQLHMAKKPPEIHALRPFLPVHMAKISRVKMKVGKAKQRKIKLVKVWKMSNRRR